MSASGSQMSPAPADAAPTVARTIVAALQAEGVDRVFGMPGSHMLSVFDALADSLIRYIAAAHENTSAFMAGMHGYLTGEPGVVLLTAGPGATNSVTGVAQAFASSFPMVHITGDVPVSARREAFHGVDDPDFLQHVFGPITKWAVRIKRAADVPDVLAEAFQRARSGRPGPVHVSLPIDLGDQRLPGPIAYTRRDRVIHRPSADFVATVAGALQRAVRPVICACRGVLLDAAERELVALAETIGAPVLTTAYGIGAIPHDHPLAIGTFSEFSKNAYAFDVIRRSDFLLLVGLRAGTAMTDILTSLAPARTAFAAFESDAATLSWGRGPSTACSARAFLTEVRAKLTPRRGPEPAFLKEMAEVRRALRRGLDLTIARESAAAVPLHFGAVVQATARLLAHDAIVVSGVGNHHVWARNLLPIRDRTSFVAEASWGTMGGELGAGIAAKLAHPERQVLVVTGDASLLMVGGDFVTAVKENARIVVLVLNDSCHGIIGAMQRQSFGRAFGDGIPRVDFAALASSLGGTGVRIEAEGDLVPGLARAFAESAGRPVLVDAVCDPRAPWPNRERLIEMGGEDENSVH